MSVKVRTAAETDASLFSFPGRGKPNVGTGGEFAKPAFLYAIGLR